MSHDTTNATASAGPLSSEELGLLKEWADAAGATFVSRSSGQRTTDTVSKDDLLQLMRAVRAAERERWRNAALAGCDGTHPKYAEALRTLVALIDAGVA